MFEIASGMSMLTEFRDTYGMRFIGLEDPGSQTYITYRVPEPEAPYPQDYVIDQEGKVRYWAWEYDPQAVIRTIEKLLAETGVEDDPPIQEGNSLLRLAPPAPNPFRGSTDLRFALAERGRVRLSIYSVSGSLVRTLVDGVRDAGEHAVSWDGKNDSGGRAASGVYFVDVSAGTERRTRRAVLIR